MRLFKFNIFYSLNKRLETIFNVNWMPNHALNMRLKLPKIGQRNKEERGAGKSTSEENNARALLDQT